ncbi:hypothetical protein Tco_1310638 [Tanacetum coccineum]
MDDEVFPAEEQPNACMTDPLLMESPGYIPESDSKEDPQSRVRTGGGALSSATQQLLVYSAGPGPNTLIIASRLRMSIRPKSSARSPLEGKLLRVEGSSGFLAAAGIRQRDAYIPVHETVRAAPGRQILGELGLWDYGHGSQQSEFAELLASSPPMIDRVSSTVIGSCSTTRNGDDSHTPGTEGQLVVDLTLGLKGWKRVSHMYYTVESDSSDVCHMYLLMGIALNMENWRKVKEEAIQDVTASSQKFLRSIQRTCQGLGRFFCVDAKGKSVRSEDLEALICMVTKCTVFKIISVYQLILNQRELEHEATPLDRTRPPHLEQKSWNLYGWEPLCSMAWSWLYCYGTMYGLCDHARVHKIEYSIHQSKDTRANIRDNGFVGTPEDTSMDIVGHYNDGFCSQSSKSSHGMDTFWVIVDLLQYVRQKSYADLKGVSRWSLRLRDKVMLKVYPGKGFVSFGQRRELNPRFVGPFKVIKRVGDVAYQDRVPEECARVLNTFQSKPYPISTRCDGNSKEVHSLLWNARSIRKKYPHLFSKGTEGRRQVLRLKLRRRLSYPRETISPRVFGQLTRPGSLFRCDPFWGCYISSSPPSAGLSTGTHPQSPPLGSSFGIVICQQPWGQYSGLVLCWIPGSNLAESGVPAPGSSGPGT